MEGHVLQNSPKFDKWLFAGVWLVAVLFVSTLAPVQHAISAGVQTIRGSVTVSNTVTVTDGAGALNVICDSGCSGGTQYAEDAPHGDGNTGTMALGVRKDAAASLAGTDGDYTLFIFDALNRLWTHPVFLTPNGDSMVNDTTDGINVHIVGDATGTAAVTDDGDIPASASVGQVAAVGYCNTVAHGSNPTAVAAAGRATGKCNRAGVPFTIGGHPNIVRTTFSVVSAQTDLSLTGTIGAGTKVVVTEFAAKTDPANSVAVTLRAGCGAVNTPAASTTGAALITDATYPASSYAGEKFGSGSGIVAACADGEEVRMTSSAATSGHLYVTIAYFTIES